MSDDTADVTRRIARLEVEYQRKLDEVKKDADAQIANMNEVLRWTQAERDRAIAQLGHAEARARKARKIGVWLMKADAAEADWRQALDA